jgi:organic hydroperoxide reductase OsmC/OhrA
MKEHRYHSHLVWDGNRGDGTSSYTSYGREYRVVIDGKPVLAGSANPMFRGDAAVHDPEDLFLASIASCHMLSYLALCAREKIRVVGYEDHAQGTLTLEGGGGKFTEVVLHPSVTIESGDLALAESLHEKAHAQCFIANSCSVPIRHEATVRIRT